MRHKERAKIPQRGQPDTIPGPTPRWQMWLGWLEDTQLAPRKRLLEAVVHASLPPQLLHQFALDCARRSMALARASGMTPPQRFEESLALKQQELDNPGDLNGAAPILDQLRREITAWGMARMSSLEKDCALSVAWALAEDPVTAARYSSLHVQFESEYEWQRAQLTTNLRALLTTRAGLLWRLHHRQLTLTGRLQDLQAQLEDALFER